MTREEAEKYIKSRMCKNCNIYLGGVKCLDNCKVIEAIKVLEQEPCDVFDKYGNYKYPSDVELTEPNTATSLPCDTCEHSDETNGSNCYECVKGIRDRYNPQPCEDTISRSDMLDAIGHGTTYTSEELQKIVKALPPVNAQQKYEDIAKAFQFGMALGFAKKYNEMDKVMEEVKKAVTPQPKTGHWIYDDEYSDWDYTDYKCSCCKRVISVPYEIRNEVYKEFPYCHCGAKMVEPQENEDKE